MLLEETSQSGSAAAASDQADLDPAGDRRCGWRRGRSLPGRLVADSAEQAAGCGGGQGAADKVASGNVSLRVHGWLSHRVTLLGLNDNPPALTRQAN